MGKRVLYFLLISGFCLCLYGEIQAQFTIQHQAPLSVNRNSAQNFEFIVPGLSENDVQRSLIYYRFDGQFAYLQKEVSFQNGAFFVALEIEDQNATQLEYYFELITFSGEQLTFPATNPQEEPVQVQIIEEQKKELPPFKLIDYSILSPKPDGAVADDDVLFSIAFFYNKPELPEGEIYLYIDDTDVTGLADTSSYYYSYVPDYLRPGPHDAKLVYKTSSEEFLIVEWQFFVIPKEQELAARSSSSYMPDGSAEIAARNQVIAGDINNAYTGNARFSGSYGQLRYSFNTFLTTQESSRLQPQNRYGISLKYADWWQLEAGHVFPRMSQFTISGRRIHGIQTSLHLLKKNFNLQLIYGALDRKISNLYSGIEIQPVQTGAGVVVDTTYTLNSEGRGAFQRNIVGGRVGFGNEEKFQIGIHAMKVQDDTTSLFNVRDYSDLISSNMNLANGLTLQDRVKLQQNPDLLNIQGGSIRPKDNIVAGADLKFGLFKNRLRFESEAVISALNNDIYNGVLTTERAEDLGFELDENTANLLERLSWLIIINENMDALPIQLSEDESGNLKADFFFPTNILAGNSELSYRHPRNNFRLQYRWIGPGFNSLANSTVRKDVAGFTLTNRTNLLSNRIYITLGAEQLNDNVIGNQDATTQTNTYRTNVSWYPIQKRLPRVSLGFRYRQRDNSVERFNPHIPAGFENAAVQNFIINTDGDTLATANPRFNNTLNFTASITQQLSFLGMTHDASLNISNLKTSDRVFSFGDVKSSAVSLNLSTRWQEKPLITQFGLSFNNTESGSGLNTINIFGIYAGANYRMMENRLLLNGRIAITNNETTSRILEVENQSDNSSANDYYTLGAKQTAPAFKTFVIQAGAQYMINEFHSVIFDANLTNISAAAYSNDRIIQLRYVFRF